VTLVRLFSPSSSSYDTKARGKRTGASNPNPIKVFSPIFKIFLFSFDRFILDTIVLMQNKHSSLTARIGKRAFTVLHCILKEYNLLTINNVNIFENASQLGNCLLKQLV